MIGIQVIPSVPETVDHFDTKNYQEIHTINQKRKKDNKQKINQLPLTTIPIKEITDKFTQNFNKQHITDKNKQNSQDENKNQCRKKPFNIEEKANQDSVQANIKSNNNNLVNEKQEINLQSQQNENQSEDMLQLFIQKQLQLAEQDKSEQQLNLFNQERNDELNSISLFKPQNNENSTSLNDQSINDIFTTLNQFIQDNKIEQVIFDRDPKENLNSEMRKKSESCMVNPDSEKANSKSRRNTKDQIQQNFNSNQNGFQIKGNYQTSQMRSQKKIDNQKNQNQQISKQGLQKEYHGTNEGHIVVDRNYTQSPPIFTRQRENDDDVKKRRQEDRLIMLSDILIPSSVTINTYLDMGCGNCEISAEIGKVYGAHQIIGCDIYPEDQFVRPSDTPNSTSFSYITNRNDSLQPQLDRSIDLITCFMVLHHVEALDKNLREIQRVIKDGGYLYIREHDVPSEDIELDSYLRYKHEKFDDCGQFMKFWGKNDLKNKLDRFGFIHQSDSLYSDNRPNRQKVYHSLFKYSLEHFTRMEKLECDLNAILIEINKSSNIKEQQPQQINNICKESNLNKNTNIEQLKEKNQTPIKIEQQQIKKQELDIIELTLEDVEASIELNNQVSKKVQENPLSDKLIEFSEKENSCSIKNTNSNQINLTSDKQNFSSSTSSTLNSSDEPFSKNNKNNQLISQNNQTQKNISSNEQQSDDYNYKKQQTNTVYNKSNRDNQQQKNSQQAKKNSNERNKYNEQEHKQSRNPNQFKANNILQKNQIQNLTQQFQFEDEGESISQKMREKYEQKVNQLYNTQKLSNAAEKQQKVPLKQARPIQLIDILS